MADVTNNNFSDILKQLINLLPSSYNKETSDTNYYRLLRALSLELNNAQIEVKKLNDDMYLKTVSADKIFNNFGTLVKLKKSADWDDEKYRRLIQGVMQSLLRGPTKQSLVDGLRLFTNFNVNVYELYKDIDKVDVSLYEGLNPQFSFILEIEKPLEDYAEQANLIRDANYIISIIKPAHTINLIVTTLVSDESYRKSYRERFNIDEIQSHLPPEQQLVGLPDYYNMDIVDIQSSLNYKDNYYGYHHRGPGIFTTLKSKIVGTDVIAPKKTLYDYSITDFDLIKTETVSKPSTEMEAILLDRSEVYNTLTRPVELEILLQNIEEVFKMPTDHNSYEFAPEGNFEEHFDFVSSSGTLFQLGSSLLSGNAILGTASKDVITEVSTEKFEIVDLQKITSSLELSGFDFAETFPRPFDESDDFLDYALSSEDSINIPSVLSSQMLDLVIDTSELFDKNKIIFSQEIFQEFNEDYIANLKILDSRNELAYDLVESINMGSITFVFESDVIVNNSEVFDYSDIVISMNELSFEGYSDVYQTSNIDNQITAIDVENQELVQDPKEALEIDSGESSDVYDKSTILDLTQEVENEISEVHRIPNKVSEARSSQTDLLVEENYDFVSVEELPRFVFNQTPIGIARLGGLIRDQLSMELHEVTMYILSDHSIAQDSENTFETEEIFNASSIHLDGEISFSGNSNVGSVTSSQTAEIVVTKNDEIISREDI